MEPNSNRDAGAQNHRAGPFIRLNYSGPNPGAFPDGARIIGQALAANR